MIRGIGNDIVENQRIASICSRHGQRFIQRIFAPEEISYCMDKADPVIHLAVRFAAKEAFVKALGTGFSGLALNEIALVPDPSGRPRIELTGKTKEIAESQKIDNILVSLSHERLYSLATVILEQNI